MDALKAYLERPTTLHRTDMRETVENLLDNVADDQIPDENLIEYLFHLLRRVDIRLEPYVNAPVKGIITIPLEHESLASLRTDLARALAPVLRAAVKEACLKRVVDEHPG